MLKNDTSNLYANILFKYVLAFMLFSFLMVLFASRAYAGFSFNEERDPEGKKHYYFSFEHWQAWEDAGGYVEVTYTPALPPTPPGTEQIKLRIEASQKRFYMEHAGQYHFLPKLANGDPASSVIPSGVMTVINNDNEYNGSLDKYKNLDVNNPDHWKDNNASPINHNKNYSKPNPTNPNPSTGGGDGGSGGNGDGGSGGDGGNGNGGSGGDGGDSEGGGSGGCSCFKTEEWQDLMDTLDGIRNKIPPPPNWQNVANTMRDTIVPPLTSSLTNSLTNSFRDMLGTAPSPPSAPATLDVTPPSTPAQPPVHDYARELDSNAPTFNDVSGLDEASNFSADDIKSEAPEIQFRDDESGGFNITNPLDSLPSLPYDGFPMPGQDAGAWDHQPQQQTDFKPPVPDGGANYEPPTPGGGTNYGPPIPDSGNYQPPTNNPGNYDWGNYKPHPNAPDGSGW